ncbi:MAG: ATP-dependent DNA helicase Rep [Gammaproteobacteria bacterium]|nr:ATP-dependent DNA helicase Rep [Gammaproteobacteria bacterium]
MNQLNPPQREAVRYTAGPLLVLAGAGSGKTRVIAQKIAYLISQCAVAPEHIAAITFTNKAAHEMRERVSPLLAHGVRAKPWISTFHTLGLRILREEFAAIGYRAKFTLFDSRDTDGVIADIARRNLGSNDFDVRTLGSHISNWKSSLVEPSQALREAHDPRAIAAARCYAEYANTLLAYNAVDFDDLIVLPVRILRHAAALLLKWQVKLRWLLVDEYQDTNLAQYDLVKLLAQPAGRLTVVGDDDQSIYAWRGARPENLVTLTQDFPLLKVIKLEQNYRSMGVILKAANKLISHNPRVFEKRLWSERGYGDKIRVRAASDEIGEADTVANDIVYDHLLHTRKYSDYAILFRSNYQARPFEQALRERDIPYVISGARSFFDSTEIKDVVCYLRLVANPQDDNALLRVINNPRRGIGTATIEALVECASVEQSSLGQAILSAAFAGAVAARSLKPAREFATWLTNLNQQAEGEPPLAIIKTVLNDIDYQEWLKQTSETAQDATRRWNNVGELLRWVERMGTQDETRTLSDIVTSLTLYDLMERKNTEEDRDAVSLMTLHAVKGLEFPHVYLVGFEENLLPHRSSIDADTIEEERRLAYVGITRAQQTLSLSYVRARRRFGRVESCVPSRFLAEMPTEDLRFDGAPEDAAANRSKGQSTLARLKGLLGP